MTWTYLQHDADGDQVVAVLDRIIEDANQRGLFNGIDGITCKEIEEHWLGLLTDPASFFGLRPGGFPSLMGRLDEILGLIGEIDDPSTDEYGHRDYFDRGCAKDAVEALIKALSPRADEPSMPGGWPSIWVRENGSFAWLHRDQSGSEESLAAAQLACREAHGFETGDWVGDLSTGWIWWRVVKGSR